MFTLSHGFATHRQKWTLTLAHVSLWLSLVGVWTHWAGFMWAGGILGIGTFATQLVDMRGILKKRMRKKVEPPIRAVVTGVAAGILGSCLFLAQLAWRSGHVGWQSVVLFYLLGAVTFTVMGFAYKIVPFLVWSKRHSKGTTKGKRILISDLINLNRAWPVLIGFAIGLILLTGSSASLWTPGAIGGCVLIALAIFTFSVQIMRVIQPQKVVKELLDRD